MAIPTDVEINVWDMDLIVSCDCGCSIDTDLQPIIVCPECGAQWELDYDIGVTKIDS